MSDHIRFRKLADQYFDRADRAAENGDMTKADEYWATAAAYDWQATQALKEMDAVFA